MKGTVGRSGRPPLQLSTGGAAAPSPRPRGSCRGASGYFRTMSMPSRAEVVVVGAGLAGLSAATRLAASGGGGPLLGGGGDGGGRLATERIDGFVVDRGFQVLNTGSPRVAADLDLG